MSFAPRPGRRRCDEDLHYMRSISGIWKSSFLFAVVAALLAFSVPAFAAPDINRIAFEGNSKVKTD
ncbi:MAG: hypothetical protein WBO09_03865, partial [Methylocystis silviterrae]